MKLDILIVSFNVVLTVLTIIPTYDALPLTEPGKPNKICSGKPFGSPCKFIAVIDPPTGYCDNDICIFIPKEAENSKCDSNNGYTCGNGECIDAEWRCDGENDCHDGTDEFNCDNLELMIR